MRARGSALHRQRLRWWSCGLLLVLGVLVIGTGLTGPGSQFAPRWMVGSDADRRDAPLPGSATVGREWARQAPERQLGMGSGSIRIPALGVTGSIGFSTVVDGVLIPPRRTTAVGLWSGSAPLDAAAGTTTIAGHVSWAGMGAFVFAKLASLRPGSLVYTSDRAGDQTAWRVTRVYARSKSKPIDPDAFRGLRGPRRLVLVTCGGHYDAEAHFYEANVYVYARPVPAGGAG